MGHLPETGTGNNKGEISYTYDAAGVKVAKRVQEYPTTANGNITTNTITYYINGFVYETRTDDNAGTTDYTDRLQFLCQEQGRIRYNPAEGSAEASFEYDYMIKDHLGNVRMVLTEEQKQDAYPAVTFETANTSNEQEYYENAGQHITDRPGSFFNSTDNGDKVQLLRKSTGSIGAGKLLKVMATDKVHVKVDYYIPNDATDNSNADGIDAILTSLAALLNAAPNTIPVHGEGTAIAGALETSVPFTDFLDEQTTSTSSSQPKAYLNILFFDACPGSEAIREAV